MSAFLSHKFGLIFPHVPRTGGTSLEKAVHSHLGEDDIGMYQLEKHQSLRIFKVGFPKEFERYVKFAVVRHPLDRFVSLYQGYLPKCSSLDDMVYQLYKGMGELNIQKYAFYWPLKRWLCDEQGELLADKVFKLEDGTDQITQFLNDHGIPISRFPHTNKGPENYSKACSTETMKKIRELYAWDYEAFDYE